MTTTPYNLVFTTNVTLRQRDLDDARSELTRYRRMCALLFSGIFIGVVGFVLCGVAMMAWNLDSDSGIWFLGLPLLALIVACGAAFIAVVTVAHESHGKNHPAVKVRVAQHAYDDALDAAVEEG